MLHVRIFSFNEGVVPLQKFFQKAEKIVVSSVGGVVAAVGLLLFTFWVKWPGLVDVISLTDPAPLVLGKTKHRKTVFPMSSDSSNPHSIQKSQFFLLVLTVTSTGRALWDLEGDPLVAAHSLIIHHFSFTFAAERDHGWLVKLRYSQHEQPPVNSTVDIAADADLGFLVSRYIHIHFSLSLHMPMLLYIYVIPNCSYFYVKCMSSNSASPAGMTFSNSGWEKCSIQKLPLPLLLLLCRIGK